MLKAVNQLIDKLLLLHEQVGVNNIYYPGYISYRWLNDDTSILDTRCCKVKTSDICQRC